MDDVTDQILETRKLKLEMGLKCQCDEPTCAKCLSVNCMDENCPTHTNEAKKKWRENRG